MNAIDDAFNEIKLNFLSAAPLQTLASGELTLAHYKSVLREIYYYSREDPQIQALATVYFRGKDREQVKPFLRHAISEVGHDELALNDLRALGEDVDNLPFQSPLPTTMGLIAYPFYQINYQNPIGYLGYLYFLEHLPTSSGDSIGGALAAAGIPPEAMTFLNEHFTVDFGHNQLMRNYLQELVKSDADRDAVIQGMETTGVLYSAMLQGAIDSAEEARRLPDHSALARNAA
ncbi:MAG: iron-containing redox enzyme family protein [Pseudomonadota bacterium]